MLENVFDIFAICLLSISGLYGFYKGFISSLMRLATWSLAHILSLQYAFVLQDLLVEFIPNTLISQYIAYGGTFFSIILIFSIINFVVDKAVRFSPLALMNRLLGFVFGVATGCVVLTIVVMVVNTLQIEHLVQMHVSKSYDLIMPLTAYVSDFVPDDVASFSVQKMASYYYG